jgi:hypothetical protein
LRKVGRGIYTEVKNWRPISLLNTTCIGKVMEMMMAWCCRKVRAPPQRLDGREAETLHRNGYRHAAQSDTHYMGFRGSRYPALHGYDWSLRSRYQRQVNT